MKRRTKLIIALPLCVIPIVLIAWTWGPPIVVFTTPVSVHCNWQCVDEESFEVEVAWPYWQIKVDVEVEGYTGHHTDPSIVKMIEIHDSAGNFVRNLTFTAVGNYTTGWFFITQIGGIVPIYEVYNITARGNGWLYGGWHGQITIYACGIINVFYYGEYPAGYSPP